LRYDYFMNGKSIKFYFSNGRGQKLSGMIDMPP